MSHSVFGFFPRFCIHCICSVGLWSSVYSEYKFESIGFGNIVMATAFKQIMFLWQMGTFLDPLHIFIVVVVLYIIFQL